MSINCERTIRDYATLFVHVKDSKKHGNKFEFSHEEGYTVVHLPLILMEPCFFAKAQKCSKIKRNLNPHWLSAVT